MELTKLTRDSMGGRIRTGIATVSFTQRGLVILSSCAVKKIECRPGMSVDIFQGDRPSDFCISKGNSYKLRKNGDGGAVFNCIALSSFVIEKTWRISPHNALEQKAPSSMSFVICEKPVDDKENSHIYALLRKKA